MYRRSKSASGFKQVPTNTSTTTTTAVPDWVAKHSMFSVPRAGHYVAPSTRHVPVFETQYGASQVTPSSVISQVTPSSVISQVTSSSVISQPKVTSSSSSVTRHAPQISASVLKTPGSSTVSSKKTTSVKEMVGEPTVSLISSYQYRADMTPSNVYSRGVEGLTSSSTFNENVGGRVERRTMQGSKSTAAFPTSSKKTYSSVQDFVGEPTASFVSSYEYSSSGGRPRTVTDFRTTKISGAAPSPMTLSPLVAESMALLKNRASTPLATTATTANLLTPVSKSMHSRGTVSSSIGIGNSMMKSPRQQQKVTVYSGSRGGYTTTTNIS